MHWTAIVSTRSSQNIFIDMDRDPHAQSKWHVFADQLEESVFRCFQIVSLNLSSIRLSTSKKNRLVSKSFIAMEVDETTAAFIRLIDVNERWIMTCDGIKNRSPVEHLYNGKCWQQENDRIDNAKRRKRSRSEKHALTRSFCAILRRGAYETSSSFSLIFFALSLSFDAHVQCCSSQYGTVAHVCM